MEHAADGWTRFVMKSKFGAGRDFQVTDTDDRAAYVVDGKMGPRPKADVEDASGTLRYRVMGHLLGFPKHMTIETAAGDEVASIRAKVFSPIKSKAAMSMADGSEWHIEGSLVEKDYRIDGPAGRIAEISQKWITVRDAYTLDVADGADPGLVLAVVWSIDRWVERD